MRHARCLFSIRLSSVDRHARLLLKIMNPKLKTATVEVQHREEMFATGNGFKQHPFLEMLPPHARRILSDAARKIRFRAGEVIFSQGDPADRFFLLESGKVALEGHVQGRGLVRFQTLTDGEVLGWSWLFPPYFWHFG